MVPWYKKLHKNPLSTYDISIVFQHSQLHSQILRMRRGPWRMCSDVYPLPVPGDPIGTSHHDWSGLRLGGEWMFVQTKVFGTR